MYNSDPKVAAAQKVMLEILIEIHKLCVKHGLTYWLDAGTLLGAIRHKGFIPWDDDCDIAMMREDYEKFLNIAKKELPEGYLLQTRDDGSEYRLPFAKVRKEGTVLIETGETGEEDYHHGIFVDIFPYDYYKYGWFLKWMKWTGSVRDRKKRFKKGSLKRVLVTFYTNIVLLLPVQFSLFIKRYYEKRNELFKNKDWGYAACGLECYPPYVTKKEDIFPVVYIENVFEEKGFFLPRNYEKFIRCEFGDTYMELPPIEQRKTHAKYIEV